MLQLPGAQDSLADLDAIRADRWPDTEWAVLVRAQRAEVERRLLGVSLAMNALVTTEAGDVAAAVNFRSDGAKLADGARRLCMLILSEYPAAAGGG
jgi:hypothetical protein